MSASKQTHDHEEIKRWASARGGVPAKVKGTGNTNDEGVLRIHFPENSENKDDLEEIPWEDFFEKFDEEQLDFLYQEKKADGEVSTFHKFVNR
ncbi:hypothetical protein SAMN05421747_10945 [Parapedobacter composti]|uniref:1,4-alpha-glucan branching enzyme n=1 Tax=Parapedobacter composti TaxID=623281 RepID=A0A1I1IFU7_9SPHI|nr:hypothetical protein [Parapedobacter composti]SFC35154.1 hypothetical protein SAMN05421747_10945 [Parapedobacter composti]